MAGSRKGGLSYAGSVCWRLRWWDAASGVLIREFKGNSGAVSAVAFSPDGQRILSGSSDQSLRLWDTTVVHSTTVYDQFRLDPGCLTGDTFVPPNRPYC
jgi:WD40 repeat protein